jgi:bifunctional non-homologous end joining protein LigD
MPQKTLEEYEKKRHFEKTPEPPAEIGKPGTGTVFVIQKHKARSLHYDFRLESDGVLKSWAIPKGPSMDPKDKRLAVHTEDHPITYADFEGVIPKGEYGAGAVEVWDRGIYLNLKPRGKGNSISENIKNGHVEVWLQGEKICGGFALTRFRTGKNEAWLLVKMRDDEAKRDSMVEKQTRSVLTGRTIEEISASKDYLKGDPPNVRISMNGRTLALTNLNKVLYPEAKFTKADVLNYYIAISTYILPHLERRPLTMKRYPGGVEGEYFYEKSCPSFKPQWLQTATTGKTKAVTYCIVDDRASLIWVVNLASLELHVMLSKAPEVLTPTHIAFDFDPGPGRDIIDCAIAARNLRGLLSELKLESFPKTSGGKGLHLYIPLNTKASFKETKDFAHALALTMEKAYPKDITSNMRKAERKGKILLDWSQNDEHKTTVCVYSLRARPKPTVSTPLTWEEVDGAIAKKNARALSFETKDVLKRVEEQGDLFTSVLRMEQELPAIAKVK